MRMPPPTETVLEQVRDEIKRLWSGDDEDHDAVGELVDGEDGGEATPTREPASSLFQCPSCNAVYIAEQKDVCENCATEVTEV
jgi:hypothetical protein